MCLGVPGQVLSIEEDPGGMTMGKVSFGGITKSVCMTCVPEAKVGSYVVVHVGFAISVVDQAEAERTLEFLRAMDELGDLDVPQPG
jgi:hydrogenase expression/formation protein HypC